MMWFSIQQNEEELRRYTLAEHYTTLERAQEILRYGEPIQKISIYKNLPKLVQERGVEEPLILLVVKQLESQDPFLQMEAGHSFTTMITEKRTETFGEKGFLRDLLDVTLSMLRLQNILVIDSWIEVFRCITKKLRFSDISEIISEEIYELSGVCSPTPSKYAAMRIIAVIVQLEMGSALNSSLLDLITLFSQVSDMDIKQVVVSEVWPNLFPKVRQPTLDIEWLPMVIENIMDNNAPKEIRVGAITTIASTLQHFSSEAKQDKIMALLFYLITLANNPIYTPIVSSQFGHFCYYLQEELQSKSTIPAKLSTITNFIFEQLDSPISEVRVNFAYNFPCYFSLQIFASKHREKLLQSFIQLFSKDKEQSVRVQSVKSLLEVLKLTSTDEIKSYFKPAIRCVLLDTTRTECRFELSKRLPAYLQFLQSNSTSQSLIPEFLSDIIGAIEASTVNPSWRSLTHLFETLDIACERGLLTSKEQSEKYLNVIIKCFDVSNFQVKKTAGVSFVNLIEHTKVPNARETYLLDTLAHLLKARNFHQRLVYLEIIDACILKFSRAFFKQTNLFACMDLYCDKVPNVRRKLATMIARIRNCLFANDVSQIETFDMRVIHLTNDLDKDTAKTANQEYLNIRDIDSFNRSSTTSLASALQTQQQEQLQQQSTKSSNNKPTEQSSNHHRRSHNHNTHPNTFDQILDFNSDFSQERSASSATNIPVNLGTNSSLGLPPKRRNINVKKIVSNNIIPSNSSINTAASNSISSTLNNSSSNTTSKTMQSPKGIPVINALSSSRCAGSEMKSPSQTSLKLIKVPSTNPIGSSIPPRPRRNSSNTPSNEKSQRNQIGYSGNNNSSSATNSTNSNNNSSSTGQQQQQLINPGNQQSTQQQQVRQVMQQLINNTSASQKEQLLMSNGGRILAVQELNTMNAEKSSRDRKSSLSTHKNLKPISQMNQSTNGGGGLQKSSSNSGSQKKPSDLIAISNPNVTSASSAVAANLIKKITAAVGINSHNIGTLENNPNALTSTSSIFRIKKTTASSPLVTYTKKS